jgi:FlaG/FlaF family flagellin (archaellin)
MVKKRHNKNKEGLSPVIATVLLITMVVVIGLIIFLWFKSMTKEVVTKFGDENVEIACSKVQFDASYDAGVISISNSGNVPIFSFKVKTVSAGTYSTQDITALSSDWPSLGLNPGLAYSAQVSGLSGKVTLVPVLIGKSEKTGRKTFVCSDTTGYDLTV